jgi:hypothetical protein
MKRTGRIFGPVPTKTQAAKATLKRMCADNPRVLDALDQVSQREPGGANNPEGFGGKSGKEPEEPIVNDNNVNNDNDRTSPVGNSTDYALRRLRKDRPDLHTRVLNEDLTPHAAMIEAGFRKKTMTLPTGIEDLAATV